MNMPATDLRDDPAPAVRRERAWWALLPALWLAHLVLSGTPWGLGVTPDSLDYLQAANSLAQGHGLAGFSSQWPPLYPVAVAALSWLGGDVLGAGRWLNALLAAASIGLVACIARRCGWRAPFVLAFLLLLGMQAGYLHVHYLLWSEPLFLTLCLADLLLLDAALRRPERIRRWAVLVMVTAAAIMVRYAGLFLLLLNAGAMLLFLTERRPGARVARIALVSLASLLPFLAWIAFHHSQGEGAANRSLAWHPPGEGKLAMLGHTVAVWFRLPDAWGLPALAMLLAIAVHQVVLAIRRRDAVDRTVATLAMYVLAYAGFLAASVTLVDGHTPLDERILFPMLPMAWLLPAQLARGIGNRHVRSVAILVLAALLAFGAFVGWMDWRASRAEGIGLTSKRVQALPVLAWLKHLPADLPIVSNGPDLCTIYLGRSSRMLPRTYDPMSRKPNAAVSQQLEAMSAGPTLIVHFHAMAWRRYLAGPEQIERLQNLRLVYRDEDALVWVRNEQPAD